MEQNQIAVLPTLNAYSAIDIFITMIKIKTACMITIWHHAPFGIYM